MYKMLTIFFAITVLTACATVFKQHSADKVPPDQIAVLEHPDPMYSFFVIEDIDNKWRGFGLFERYELLPGERSVSSTINRARTGLTSAKQTVFFQAEGGKTYIAEALISNRRWLLQIKEKDTGEVVSYRKESSE